VDIGRSIQGDDFGLQGTWIHPQLARGMFSGDYPVPKTVAHLEA
jgi:hypothetical protein